MRAWIAALALTVSGAAAGACKSDPAAKGKQGKEAAEVAGAKDAAGGVEATGAAKAAARNAEGEVCEAADLIRVSRKFEDRALPCGARIRAAMGRVVRVGDGAGGTSGTSGTSGASGTIVSTATARGAGVVVTCRACAGATAVAGGAELVDPEREPPAAFRVWPGSEAREARRLFGPVAEGFVVAAIMGGAIAIEDPGGRAGSKAPFVDARPGAQALVLGVAREGEGEAIVASVGPILDDAAARTMVARAGGDEAATAYDPQRELVIAARAIPAMIGGGVFDEGGRFVGVVVRATSAPVDGRYMVRAVRATYVAAKLSGAVGKAPVPLRTRIVGYLP